MFFEGDSNKTSSERQKNCDGNSHAVLGHEISYSCRILASSIGCPRLSPVK